MTAKGNPTFWGFEGPRVLLQGSLGSAYRLDTDSAAMHGFQDADGNRITYGSVLVPIAESQDAPSQRGFVVLGELNGFLWVQHLAKSDPRGAFPLPVPLSQSLVAANVAAVLGVPQEDVTYVDTDHGPISLLRSALSDYDVEPQKPYFLSLFDSLVEFRGVLFHVPWVSILDAKGRRTAGDSLRPLPGCWDADVLRSLYGLCDAPIIGNQSSYTQSPRTTPRSASAPAYRVTVAGRTAVCKGSFGHSLEADISPAALKPFGLHHGDRVMVLRGPDSGKTALIVGVSKGTLIVLLEGDSKVTLVRGCTNAQEVSQQFAVGRPAAASATSTPHSTPAKKESATPLPSSIVPALKTPKQQQTSASSRDGGSMGLSPRSRGTPMFRCWTAFGRVEFDISSDRVSHFGPFEHEDSVRCTRGSSAGVTMTIVGERNGILWAVEKGKVRATPLAHCTNAAELAAMYGLEPIGKTSLRHLAEITVEPPPTPLGSPRGGLEKRGRSVEEGSPQASPRHDEVSSSSSPSAASSSQLPRAAVVLPPIRNFPTSSSSSDPSHHNSAARPLMEELEPPVSARGPSTSSPRGAAAAASSSSSTEASPLRAASESSRSLAAAAPFSGNPADGTPSGASARNYLKAVAMFMLGTSNANRVPLPFFVYYSVDTTKRLSAALKRFDTTKAAWEHSEKSKEIPRLFSEASTEDILRFLAKNPHLLPQI